MTEIYLELAFLSKKLKDLTERAKEVDKEQTYQLQQFTNKLLTDFSSDRSYGFDHFGFNNFSKSNHELPPQQRAGAFQFIHEMKAKELFHVIKLNMLHGPDYTLKYILQQKFQSHAGKRVTEVKTPLPYRRES